MAGAAMTVSDEVIRAYEDMKVREGATPEEAQQRKKAVLFRVNKDNSQVIVDEGKVILVGTAGDDPYQRFIDLLPDGECRFAVYCASVTTADVGDKEGNVFITWTPKNAPIKSQLLYSTIKHVVRRELVEIKAEMEATSREELEDRHKLAKKLESLSTIIKLEGKNL
ncbi:cofilin-1-like [Eublepharis macularius]|uniref:Cofilin-1-like n=1 Tax=Eublepharis macularius TaxID=481883 RepID=A0AA97JHB3_EUBMA|nr:cofilin-1-like [Eublepharis macularius]XP_054838193.1 cofilin-1-like [Eublepharis macularius]